MSSRLMRAITLQHQKPAPPYLQLARSVYAIIQSLAVPVGIVAVFVTFLNADFVKNLQTLDSGTFLILISPVVIICLVYYMLEFWFFFGNFRETQPISISKNYPLLPKRLSAERLVERSKSGDSLIVDGAIEIIAHPHLDYDIGDNGWSHEDVRIEVRDKEFPYNVEVFGTPVVPKQDNKRFSLVGIDTVLADQSSHLILTIAETRWSKVTQSKKLILTTDARRHDLLSLDVRKNKIPHSFCLHAVLVFSDNSIMALKRLPDLEYWPDHFSLSFEEQIGEEDIHAGPNRMNAWFRRALCEEVFPLTGPAKSEEAISAWQHVEKFVQSTRVWSVILEEPSASFALYGVIQLTLTPSEYRQEFERIRQELGTRRDNEGKIFFVAQSEIEKLTKGRTASAQSVFDDEVAILSKLHPTSLYRATCVHAAMRQSHERK